MAALAFDVMGNLPLKLRYLMGAKKIQNKELAALIGKTPQTVSGYINLTNPVQPPIEVLRKIAEVLDRTVEYLVSENDPAQPPNDELGRLMQLLKQKNPAQYNLIRDLIDNLLN